MCLLPTRYFILRFCCQSHLGFHSSAIARAGIVGLTDGDFQEDDGTRDVWARPSVSITPFSTLTQPWSALIIELIAMKSSICALTAYRLRAYHKDLRSQYGSTLYGTLASLELILGILSACLPLLKPIINRFWKWTKAMCRRKDDTNTSFFGSIPIWIQLSQRMESRSARRTRRDELDSILEMYDGSRNRDITQSTSADREWISGKDIGNYRTSRVLQGSLFSHMRSYH